MKIAVISSITHNKYVFFEISLRTFPNLNKKNVKSVLFSKNSSETFCLNLLFIIIQLFSVSFFFRVVNDF